MRRSNVVMTESPTGILSGYVDAWNQADVVDSKTSDFFHAKASFSLVFMIAKFVDKGKEER